VVDEECHGTNGTTQIIFVQEIFNKFFVQDSKSATFTG